MHVDRVLYVTATPVDADERIAAVHTGQFAVAEHERLGRIIHVGLLNRGVISILVVRTYARKVEAKGESLSQRSIEFGAVIKSACASSTVKTGIVAVGSRDIVAHELVSARQAQIMHRA